MSIESKEAKDVYEYINEDINTITHTKHCCKLLNTHLFIDFSKLGNHIVHVIEEVNIEENFKNVFFQFFLILELKILGKGN